MDKKSFEIEKNPEAIALEYATNRIRKIQKRERWERLAVLVLSVVLLMMCIAWSIDGDGCDVCESGMSEEESISVRIYEATEPKINLLLRERTMKRGVY